MIDAVKLKNMLFVLFGHVLCLIQCGRILSIEPAECPHNF